MTRRLFTPLGGAIAFAALALLVGGVLCWLTVAALRVEDDQRRAAIRADRAAAERLALWQLDGRLFPVFGVENARPFAHYFPLHAPVSAGPPVRLPSPLLSVELPDWMPLHVHLDPTTGWSSPQVPQPPLASEFHADPASVPNMTAARRDRLAALNRDLPAVDTIAQLVALDELADDGMIVPVVLGESNQVQKEMKQEAGTIRDGMASRGALPNIVQAPGPAGPPPRGGLGGGGGGFGGMPSAAGGSPNNGPGGGGSGQFGQQGGGQFGQQAGGRGNNYLDNNTDLRKRAEAGEKSREEVKGATNPSQQMAAVPPAPPLMESGDPKRSMSLPPSTPPAPPTAPAAGLTDKAKDIAGKAAVAAAEKKLDEKQDETRKQAEKAKPAGSENFKLGLPQRPVPPPAVHLGNMRPVWLKATSGSEYLMLLRPARLEGKMVYQGVLLDWPAVRQLLRDEVAETLPTADVQPLRDPTTGTDRAMAALPVVLDPGPEPDPPPAGWTPLRLGLLAAWAAAIVALLAVGFGGRALIDLSERRIRFVSAVTHELRTPLTSLRLYLDLLTSGMIADEDKRREYLGTLSAESDRLNRLVENVLDFARLEKRSVRAHRQPIPAADLLADAATNWGERLVSDGRELVVVSTLPAGQLVCTDPRMAGQIIGNLIDNARKYAKNPLEPRVWLWARPGGRRWVVFEVEDRGPGVPPAARADIFRPFRRGPDADTTAGGAGLGLALAKQWAEAIGGRLAYRDADGGVGACFRLELPTT